VNGTDILLMRFGFKSSGLGSGFGHEIAGLERIHSASTAFCHAENRFSSAEMRAARARPEQLALNAKQTGPRQWLFHRI